ncbi:hypothetical protein [Amycolatopsis tolypomycina]|uniref:hypothetical protein n=1 Tax=Amycolatopsis tolypomycina TaxID=208445 RepID=UPI0033B2F914
MVEFLHRFAAGAIYALEPGRPPAFTGSCGAFLSPHTFLTAAHCVPVDRHLLVASGVGIGGARLVTGRAYHPTSDLALLHTEPTKEIGPEHTGMLHTQVFTAPATGIEDGGDFACFGYPADAGAEPVGRTIRGHMQRFFNYTDRENRTYLALEMSCPAPQGLSGSLLSSPRAVTTPHAVVTGNMESYAIVDLVSEVDDNGKVYREETRRIISYGIAVLLQGERQWLLDTAADLQKTQADG